MPVESLPYPVLEAMVQCFGRAFHYKDPVASFFSSCGVPPELINKYRENPKFIWARNLLTDLGQSEEGCLIQRKILTELCKLRGLPDEVPDRDTGISALRKLKNLALEHQLIAEELKKKAKSRNEQHEAKRRIVEQRRLKLEELRSSFNNGLIASDRQQAGYSLEDIFREICSLYEIEYRKSYRTATQQIDGYFKLDGFDYLVEAKWRKDQPTEQEIGGFKQKVDTKIESTRGLFLSVNGFRAEVIDQFSRRGSNIVLMDGSHLIHVLEGRADIRDVLRTMIEKAVQEGSAFTPVSML